MRKVELIRGVSHAVSLTCLINRLEVVRRESSLRLAGKGQYATVERAHGVELRPFCFAYGAKGQQFVQAVDISASPMKITQITPMNYACPKDLIKGHAMTYIPRIADEILGFKLETFGATLIVGPKGCGKTTTAKQQARSFVELQDEDRREGYLAVAASQPSRLLIGENPRLIDEWQDAPKIWGAVRKSVDDRQENGLYILTGSTSQVADTPHTGTMRISRMEMQPMSLFESGESNGTVSLGGSSTLPNRSTAASRR